MLPTPVPSDLKPRLAIQCDAAAIWRGRFIEEFALAEMAVSEALAALANLPGHRRKIALPHQVGQRFAALTAALDVPGPFSREGVRVVQELTRWTDLFRVRALLCHGSGKIMIGQDGRWRIHLKYLDFRGSKIRADEIEIDQHEADACLELLWSARIRLEGQLKGMLVALNIA